MSDYVDAVVRGVVWGSILGLYIGAVLGRFDVTRDWEREVFRAQGDIAYHQGRLAGLQDGMGECEEVDR